MSEYVSMILKEINQRPYNSILDYFRALKLYFTAQEICEMLNISKSSYYNFNSRAKKGIILEGSVLRKLQRLRVQS